MSKFRNSNIAAVTSRDDCSVANAAQKVPGGLHRLEMKKVEGHIRGMVLGVCTVCLVCGINAVCMARSGAILMKPSS